MHRRLENRFLVKKEQKPFRRQGRSWEDNIKAVLQEQVVMMRFWFKKLSVGKVSWLL